MKIFWIAILLFFYNTAFCQFEYKHLINTGDFLSQKYPGIIKATDLDGDGDVDILYDYSVWENTHGIQYRLNDGNGNFTLPYEIQESVFSKSDLNIININNDKYPDVIAVSGEYGIMMDRKVISIWENNEGTSFSSPRILLDTLGINIVHVHDYTKDGYDDIVVNFGRYIGTSTSLILKNPGPSGSWEKEYISSNVFGTERFKLVDLSNNGITDTIQYTIEGNNTSPVFYINKKPVGVAGNFLEVADFDGDGRKDLLTYDHKVTQYGSIVWYRNVESGFIKKILTDLGDELDEVSAAEVADMDKDGDVDIMMSVDNYINIAWNGYFENLGDGTFLKHEKYIVGAFDDRCLQLADLNGDSAIDVLWTNYRSREIAWLEKSKNENTHPVLDPIPDQRGYEHSFFAYRKIKAFDPNGGQDLHIFLDSASIAKGLYLVPTLQYSAFDKEIYWDTPGEIDDGDHTITLFVTDGEDTTFTAFNLNIYEMNQAPILSGIPDTLVVNEEDTINFVIDSEDYDLPPQDIKFYLFNTSIQLGASLDTLTGEFFWIPVEDQTGTFQIEFYYSDGNASYYKRFFINVNKANKLPVVDPVDNKMIYTDSLLQFTIEAVDTDLPTQDLEYSLDSNSANLGMQINEFTGVFAWKPNTNQAGLYTVTVFISDGYLIESISFNITVVSTNTAPEFVNIGDQSIQEHRQIQIQVYANDRDFPKQPLTYSIDSASASRDIVLNNETQTIIWRPSERDDGIHNVKTYVTDGELVDSMTFTITVSEHNEPPKLALIDDHKINESRYLSFQNRAIDNDIPIQMLTYSIDSLSSTLGMNIHEDGTFEWSPDDSLHGNFIVEIRVTDGELSDIKNFTVSVNQLITSIDNKISNIQLIIYPNPTANEVIVEVKNNYFGPTVITMINSIGTVVKQFKVDKNENLLKHKILITDVVPGIYVIIVEQGEDIYKQNFIKY